MYLTSWCNHSEQQQHCCFTTCRAYSYPQYHNLIYISENRHSTSFPHKLKGTSPPDSPYPRNSPAKFLELFLELARNLHIYPLLCPKHYRNQRQKKYRKRPKIERLRYWCRWPDLNLPNQILCFFLKLSKVPILRGFMTCFANSVSVTSRIFLQQ